MRASSSSAGSSSWRWHERAGDGRAPRRELGLPRQGLLKMMARLGIQV
ncbi:MAG TPA: hypothetical protein VFS23_21405 [Vicinamibacterales bacterium]|nr:hypothetical protein [Vicinamibacterales bacterium]